MVAASNPSAPHTPVLLRPILSAVAPVEGVWLDGTFGAGGYTRGFLEAGAARVIAVDREPAAQKLAKDLGADVVLDGGPDLIEQVKDITGGGAHVVIDFVGELGVENRFEMVPPNHRHFLSRRDAVPREKLAK